MSFHPHCNSCAVKIDSSSFVGDCGHFFCSTCANQNGYLNEGQVVVRCNVCKQDKTTWQLSEGGSMVDQLQEFMVDPTSNLSKVARVSKFQSTHYISVIETLQQRINEFRKSEMAALTQINQYKSEIERLHRRVMDLEAEQNKPFNRRNENSNPPTPRIGNSILGRSKEQNFREFNPHTPSRRSPFSPMKEDIIEKPISPFAKRPVATLHSEDDLVPTSVVKTPSYRLELYDPRQLASKPVEEKRVPTPMPNTRTPNGVVKPRPSTPVHIQRSLLQKSPLKRPNPFPSSPALKRPSLLPTTSPKSNLQRKPVLPDRNSPRPTNRLDF